MTRAHLLGSALLVTVALVSVASNGIGWGLFASLVLATGEGKFSTTLEVAVRHDKRNMRQFYAKQFAGATRLQGPGVIEMFLKKE